MRSLKFLLELSEKPLLGTHRLESCVKLIKNCIEVSNDSFQLVKPGVTCSLLATRLDDEF